jgi:hypothetical protein
MTDFGLSPASAAALAAMPHAAAVFRTALCAAPNTGSSCV